jgi:hypothetical protein
VLIRRDKPDGISSRWSSYEKVFQGCEEFLPVAWSGKIVVTVEGGKPKQLVTVKETDYPK